MPLELSTLRSQAVSCGGFSASGKASLLALGQPNTTSTAPVSPPQVPVTCLPVAVEADEVDRDAAVLFGGVDRGDDVAIGERGDGERLLHAAGPEIDLGEAVFAEARVGRAVGIEAADDDDGLRVGFGRRVAAWPET